MVLALITAGIAAVVATISYVYTAAHRNHPVGAANVERQVMRTTGLFAQVVYFIQDVIAVLRGVRSFSSRKPGTAPPANPGAPTFNQVAADTTR